MKFLSDLWIGLKPTLIVWGILHILFNIIEIIYHYTPTTGE